MSREAKRVGYPIVLFTPDDLGRSVKETNEKPARDRTVILELGFFIAKLGSDKVTEFCTIRRSKYPRTSVG